jgi:hypothetical protein
MTCFREKQHNMNLRPGEQKNRKLIPDVGLVSGMDDVGRKHALRASHEMAEAPEADLVKLAKSLQ